MVCKGIGLPSFGHDAPDDEVAPIPAIPRSALNRKMTLGLQLRRPPTITRNCVASSSRR
jgi:hypothetical protein